MRNQLTKSPDVAPPAFRFAGADLDPADTASIRRKADLLLARPLESPGELRRYVQDWSELAARVWGEWARRHIAMNRDTADEALRERNREFNGTIRPLWQNLDDRLNRRYLDSPHRAALAEELAVFDRNRTQAAEIFREDNSALEARDVTLAAEYQQLFGGVTVEYRGSTLTRERCATHLLDPDRDVRRDAFVALAASTRPHEERFDAIFDEQLGLRQQAAANAGFEDYLGYGFAEKLRFDYTPEDCEAFHAAVEAVVRPALRELHEVRRARLGLDTVRPWDGGASLFRTRPAELFSTQEEFEATAARVFDAIDPRFAADFDVLVRNGLLDLMSRPNKAPGGYNCPVEDIGLPFIFHNGVGRRGDLRVILHEGGHAFHTIAARGHDVIDYRHTGSEFAEVASMSMELFGLRRLEGVLPPDELREFTFDEFFGALRVLLDVAVVDAFQLWLYRNPGHDAAARRARWVELSDRFGVGVDWAGLEDVRATRWQWIQHLFTSPLYYIEYGIAQLGALQMWRLEREDHEAAVEGYRKALALGGSRPLPELFEAAGIRFAMDEAVLTDLVPEVMGELRALLRGA